jgi:hypothetical protein
MNRAFAKIPIGVHTMLACPAFFLFYILLSILLRSVLDTIVPFEAVLLGTLGMPLMTVLYGMIKFIPVKNERTGRTKRWAIGIYLRFLRHITIKTYTYIHTHTHTHRNMDSHACIASIRSESQSCRETSCSNHVRVLLCVCIPIIYDSHHLILFISCQPTPQKFCNVIRFCLPSPRWTLLSIRNLPSSSSYSRVLHRSSWFRV